MFLSQEQIEELTGLKRPSAQAKWLEAHGWRYTLRSDGRVVVHELEAQRRLCGGTVGRKAVREEPDLEAIRR